MADCIFCRIVSGDLPSDEVASGEQAVAFRDVSPIAPTHVLVIPRRHVADAGDIGPDDGELLAEMIELAQEVVAREGLAERGYRLVFNVGEDAGNTVPHLHLHVLGGRRLGWPPG